MPPESLNATVKVIGSKGNFAAVLTFPNGDSKVVRIPVTDKSEATHRNPIYYAVYAVAVELELHRELMQGVMQMLLGGTRQQRGPAYAFVDGERHRVLGAPV